ncbi:hypothetical protein L596_000875 [Steinernema carpocapsae]|uniref:Uncharacterized protein n=1 Tax=Steinernema carpocapsae TaxID=34508 RepID=A0A4U8UKP1_STECR|nr:hypothetical protein L596_000875 [Steinernema carpocapsae]
MEITGEKTTKRGIGKYQVSKMPETADVFEYYDLIFFKSLLPSMLRSRISLSVGVLDVFTRSDAIDIADG